MTGSVIIDGIDIYNAYNAILLRGGDVDFLYLPSRKEPTTVSWFEHSGCDVDLEDLALQCRDVTMTFRFSASNTFELIRALDSFYLRISARGYRHIYLHALDKYFDLRYITCDNYSQRGSLSRSGAKAAQLQVRFAVDNPSLLYSESFTEPLSPWPFLSHVKINNKDLSLYSIIVQDVYTSTLILPAIKAPLVMSSDCSSGSYVSVDSSPTFDPFNITIKCSVKCSNISQYFNNMSALFAQLISTELIELTLPAANKSYKCYYVRQDNLIKKHSFNPFVYVSFDLVLKSVSYELLDYILGSELMQAIITEDNKLIMLN